MKPVKKAVLLMGSPKLTGSASASLASYLSDLLQERNILTTMITLIAEPGNESRRSDLLQELDRCDLAVLVFPLYIDSLPAHVISTLETIARFWRERGAAGGLRFAAICNCGFPEAQHTALALDMCRQFTRETGIAWAGGLGFGGGGALGGRRLDQAGGMFRNVRRSLTLAADALADGLPIPDEAVALMSRQLIPKWFYLFMGNYGWKSRAKKNGVLTRLRDRPYADLPRAQE